MNNKSTIAALAMLVLLASCACLGAFASWTPRRYQRISDMPVSMLAQSIRDRMVYRWDN